jgi:hypothetical protein
MVYLQPVQDRLVISTGYTAIKMIDVYREIASGP